MGVESWERECAPRWCAIALALMMTGGSQAAFRVGAPFSDHMVLQRGVPIPVKGTGNPCDEVRVAMAGRETTASVAANGNWLATLPALAPGGPHELVVEGKGETVRLRDVLVGDVWLCSGQSNMQMPVRELHDAAQETARAKAYPMVRLLAVPKAPSDRRMDSVGARWRVCSPESVEGFSTIGWYFGRGMHDSQSGGGVAIGLIDSSFGGTMVEAWMSTETLTRDFKGEELRDSMFGFKPASCSTG